MVWFWVILDERRTHQNCVQMCKWWYHPTEFTRIWLGVFLVNGIFLVDSNTSIFVVSEYKDHVIWRWFSITSSDELDFTDNSTNLVGAGGAFIFFVKKKNLFFRLPENSQESHPEESRKLINQLKSAYFHRRKISFGNPWSWGSILGSI